MTREKMNGQQFMIGIAFESRGIMLMFGYRMLEVWFPVKWKKFGMVEWRYPSKEQCAYTLNKNRGYIKKFFGYVKF